MAKQDQLISERKMREFGRDYVKILGRFLLSNKPFAKVASGALLNSLDYRLVDDAKNIQIIANKYLQYVDKGRRPGSYPPIQAIKQWASIKGIPQSAVFPIARKIFKFGIKPTNVIQKTVREIETSRTIRKKYEDEGVNNLINRINEEFKYI